VVVVAIVLGTYTNFALDVGALIYGLVPLIGGACLFLRHLGGNPLALRSVIQLVVISSVVNLGSAAFPTDAIELLQSTLLLIASVIAGIGLFLELRLWPRRWLELLVAGAAITVIVLGYLEAFTRFAQVSDAARETLYAAEGQFLYSSDERDLFLHGTVRPKIFTQEPSHPAKFLAITLAAWFLVSARPQKLVVVTIAFALAINMLRSPSLLAGPALVLYFLWCGSDGDVTARTATKRLLVLGLCAFLIASLPAWAAILPFERAQDIAQGLDPSTIIRLEGPMQIAAEIVHAHPLFGVGIGGKEYAWETMLGVYSNFPSVKLERFYLVSDAGWGNAFFQFVAYTGIGGAILMLWWLARVSDRLVVKDWPSILFVFFLVFSIDGSFKTVRPWMYLFLIAAAYHVRVRDRVMASANAT
jgi:hypothetical protein